MFYPRNNFLAASQRMTVIPVREMSIIIVNPAIARNIPPRSGLYLGIVDTPFLLCLELGECLLSSVGNGNRHSHSCDGMHHMVL